MPKISPFFAIPVMLLAFFPGAVSASQIATFENKNVRPNAGIVEYPRISIKDEAGLPGSLSGSTTFSLVLSSESNVRLSRTSASTVTASGIVLKSVSVSDDLRILRIDTASPLVSGVSFFLDGISAVAYNRYSPLRGFDLDVGSDGSLEAYDPNGIRVTDQYGTPDTTPPHDPVGVRADFTNASVFVSALPSGDLDFETFRVDVLTASGVELSNSAFTSLDRREIALPSSASSVKVRSVDRYGNVSSGTLIEKFQTVPASEVPSSSGATTPSTSSSGATSESVSDSGSTASGAVNGTGTAILAPLYVPTYRKAGLTTLIASMDAFVADRSSAFPNTDAAAVRLIRNDLAKLFESLYRAPFFFQKKAYVPTIKAKVMELKALFR